MSSIAVGIVGFGKIARDQHAPAICATEGMQLAAIADPISRDAGFPCYPDLSAMLDAVPEIGAVSLCMPPCARASAARQAIAAGRHVLLEKPSCATLAEAEELTRLARSAGVSLFTAWHSQEAAGVAVAREWLANSAVRSIQVTWKEDVRVWHPRQAWIWQEGGFGVFDPGINALSILTAILPGEMRVTDGELSVPVNCATPIAARLTLESSSGFQVGAEFDFRQTGPQSWDIAIATDRGPLRLTHGGNRLEIGGMTQDVGEEAEYRALYARFAALIHSGASEIDLAPLRLVEDALASGRIVPVEAFEELA
jgi:D-galactose 1-dehydrogenase